MSKYGSSLIGLDVKSKKQTRLRRNHYRTQPMQGLIIGLIAAAFCLVLFLLSGAR